MSNKITKNDIVDSIYNTTGVSKQDISTVIDAFCEEIKSSLSKGSTVELRRFGTFEPRLRKGREVARNPKTGEKVSCPSHFVAFFKSGKDLKSKLWELPVDEK